MYCHLYCMWYGIVILVMASAFRRLSPGNDCYSGKLSPVHAPRLSEISPIKTSVSGDGTSIYQSRLSTISEKSSMVVLITGNYQHLITHSHSVIKYYNINMPLIRMAMLVNYDGFFQSFPEAIQTHDS